MKKMPAIATAKPERAQVALEAFAADYLRYQYEFVEFFVEHLIDTSQAFNGDLQLMLILAILGQVRIRAVRDCLRQGMPESEALRHSPGISASRLADITAIPRETVRRKLVQLEALGWAEKAGDQTWTVSVTRGTSAVRNDLRDVDGRSMARIARLYAQLEDMVDPKGADAQNEQGDRSR